MISQPGSFASRSPFRTATLPGITSFLHLNLSAHILFSMKNLEIEVEENLPAAQDVSTESPPASLITRLHGTPERSSSPDTRKYVSAKSTVVRTYRVLISAVQRIDTRLYLHWLLRIGEYVLTQTIQRKCLCIVHMFHNDDGTIFHCKQGQPVLPVGEDHLPAILPDLQWTDIRMFCPGLSELHVRT